MRPFDQISLALLEIASVDSSASGFGSRQSSGPATLLDQLCGDSLDFSKSIR